MPCQTALPSPAGGLVRPEIVWCALDCPGYFAAMGERLRPAVLGELVGELLAPIAGTEPLVVYAWPLGEDGRKSYAGTAMSSASGELLAASRSTWIELKTWSLPAWQKTSFRA